MSTRRVAKWVQKRENLAKIEALKEAHFIVKQDRESALSKIETRINELGQLVGSTPVPDRLLPA
jgi:hypothetical protein